MEILLIIGIVLVVGFLLGRGSSSQSKMVTPPQVVNQHNETIQIARAAPKAKIDNILPDNLVITEEFQASFNLMENTSESVFITGKAGTGKSTLLKYFRSKTKKKVVVLAPTGIAAINVSGATVHSFFRFPLDVIEPARITRIEERVRLFNEIDLIIIDEVSMVRADMMDGIDYCLRLHRGNALPFGGVQMVFFGDLYQLPPVVVGQELQNYFNHEFGSPYFFSARAFRTFAFRIIELQRIFRQRDPSFIHLLNNIREGRTIQNELSSLNRRVVPNFTANRDDLFITLATTNKIADAENQRRLNHLTTPVHTYQAIIEGTFEQSAYPTDFILTLKKGAQIMMTKNDSGKRWVNGTIGKVSSLKEDMVEVDINGSKYEVEKAVWEVIEYRYNQAERKIEPIVKGSFKQFPIKLAWAVTIHKSQGRTFDQVVIDLGTGAFAHGQTYVALSRCTSFEGIILKQNVNTHDIIIDRRVREFMQQRMIVGNN